MRLFQSRPLIGAVLCVSLVTTGCTSLTGSKIHKSAKGSVHLQEVADWSFEASHPAIIDHSTMLKVVKGVLTDDAPSATTKMPASGSKPMRVFSDEDAEFLAPLLAQGLSQAKPEQIVGFTVSSSAGSGAEPTAGSLFVQGSTIHFTVGKKVSAFAPSAAAKMEKASSYAAVRMPGAMTIIIDYQTLARTAGAASTTSTTRAHNVTAKVTEPPPATASTVSANPQTPTTGDSGTSDDMLNRKLDELRQAREINAQKESEIAVLRKEIAWMKQELRERTEEVKAMRASKVSSQPAPKKRTADAAPAR